MRCGIVGSAMGRGILFADGVAGVLFGLYGVLSCLCEVSTCCDSAKAEIGDNAFG